MLYVAIFGIVYGVSAFEWMMVLRFACFKQLFPVGKRAIFRTMHHILLVIVSYCYSQVLNAVNVITVARFLPVIFNQLFHILVVTGNEEVSLNTVR